MKKVGTTKVRSIPKSKLVPGSRVPITYLFDYIKEGYSMSDFLSSYPWIKESDVKKTLDKMKQEFRASYGAQ